MYFKNVLPTVPLVVSIEVQTGSAPGNGQVQQPEFYEIQGDVHVAPVDLNLPPYC